MNHIKTFKSFLREEHILKYSLDIYGYTNRDELQPAIDEFRDWLLQQTSLGMCVLINARPYDASEGLR